LFDATVTAPFDDYPTIVAEYDRTHAYFAEVEKRLGDDATVLQLPVTWYPEHAPVNRMFDYDPFKPFLLTRTLRFSYGVAKGRPGYAMDQAIGKLPAQEQIDRAHALGFDAILVDAYAYAGDATRAAITDPLTKALHAAPSVSTDGRWWMFPLDGCCGSRAVHLDKGDVPTAFDYDPAAGTLDFSTSGKGWMYGNGGWLEPEAWGTWLAGTQARVRLRLPRQVTGSFALSLDTRALVGPKVPQRQLLIEANGHAVGEALYSPEVPAQIVRIEIPESLIAADRILELHFSVSPEASPLSAGVSVDGRSLGIGLSSLTIESSAASIPAH